MESLFIVWLTISLTGTLLMIIDKSLAVSHQKKRISERTLILTAACGAALSMWITMYLIRHKTKHIKFVAGLPVLAGVHLLLLIFLS